MDILFVGAVILGLLYKFFVSSKPRFSLLEMFFILLWLVGTSGLVYGISLYYQATGSILFLEIVIIFFASLLVVAHYRDRLLPTISVNQIIPGCGLLLVFLLYANSLTSNTQFGIFFVLLLILGGITVLLIGLKQRLALYSSLVFIALFSIFVSIALIFFGFMQPDGSILAQTSLFTYFFLGVFWFDIGLYALILGLGLPIQYEHESTFETEKRLKNLYSSLSKKFDFTFYSPGYLLLCIFLVGLFVVGSISLSFTVDINLLLFLFILPQIISRGFSHF